MSSMSSRKMELKHLSIPVHSRLMQTVHPAARAARCDTLVEDVSEQSLRTEALSGYEGVKPKAEDTAAPPPAHFTGQCPDHVIQSFECGPGPVALVVPQRDPKQETQLQRDSVP